jgi:hypothetical protein
VSETTNKNIDTEDDGFVDLVNMIIEEQIRLMDKRISIIDKEYQIAAMLNVITNIASHTLWRMAKREYKRDAFDEFITTLNEHYEEKARQYS